MITGKNTIIMQTVDLSCASCGAGITREMRQCEYCGRAVVIENFASLKNIDNKSIMLLSRQIEAGNITAVCSGGDAAQSVPEYAGAFSLACCYLRLGLYDKALVFFEKAMAYGSGNPETYFLASVAMLKGKKPFLHPMALIKKALEYLNAAEMLEPRSDFSLLTAFIKYDFFHRKCLHIEPSWQCELQKAVDLGVSYESALDLFDLLKSDIPDVFLG